MPRDGKTVGLSVADCRRLLNAPNPETPVGVRDRAIIAVLAFSACRVGELVKLRPADFKMNGVHHVLAIRGKGGKERNVPLHPEAVERLTQWLGIAGLAEDRTGPLFRPTKSPRGKGQNKFRPDPLTVRAVEYLIKRYAQSLGLDPAVTVHSLRVTALINDGSRTRVRRDRPTRFRRPCRPANNFDVHSRTRPTQQVASVCLEVLTPPLSRVATG